MAQDAVIDPTTGLPVNFDYGTEAQKIQRQRDVANQLLSYQQPQGQIFSNAAGSFYGGGTGGMGALAKMLMAYMGKNTNDSADTAQAKLNADSVTALKRDMNNEPQPTVSMVPGGTITPMGPPTPPDANAPAVANALSGAQPQPQPAPASAGNAPLPQTGPTVGMPPQTGPTPPATPTLLPGQSMGSAYATQPQATPPSQADQMAWLAKLSQDGPQGQQLANAIMANKFAKPEYATVVDPVTGKIVAYNKNNFRDGGVLSDSGGSMVTGQQTTDAGVFNTHKDGTATPMVDPTTGKQLVNTAATADQRAAVEANNNTTDKFTALNKADSAITNQLQRLNQMQDLYHNTTMDGPLLGHGPSVTKNQQLLDALTSGQSFSETANALQGASDSGAIPKITQFEIKTMIDHGLSRSTSPAAADQIIENLRANLIANQRNIATARQQYLQQGNQQSPLTSRQPNSGPGPKLSLGSF